MRVNRKTDKRKSVLVSTASHFGVILLVLIVVLGLHLSSQATCQRLQKSIGEAQTELDKLESERRRAAYAWDKMKTVRNLNHALMAHGLSMNPPRPDQLVYMKPDGSPYPTQFSLSRLGKVERTTASYRASKRK